MPDELASMMQEDANAPVSEDRLAVIRVAGEEMRAKQWRATYMDEQLRMLIRDINDMKHHRLPDLMVEAGVDRIGLPSAGNLPACDLKLRPFYKANISADWDEERRAAGFEIVEQRGYGDGIKRRIQIDIPRGDERALEEIRDLLCTAGVEFTEHLTIAWSTLTAMVKEEVSSGRPFTPAELERIGATVGLVAELKERN